MNCNESHSNGLSKIVTCNFRILDTNDMPQNWESQIN
jgi:hypothetical protein